MAIPANHEVDPGQSTEPEEGPGSRHCSQQRIRQFSKAKAGLQHRVWPANVCGYRQVGVGWFPEKRLHFLRRESTMMNKLEIKHTLSRICLTTSDRIEIILTIFRLANGLDAKHIRRVEITANMNATR